MALRVISLPRGNSVAFGVKRTLTEPRLWSAIYEYTPLIIGSWPGFPQHCRTGRVTELPFAGMVGHE